MPDWYEEFRSKHGNLIGGGSVTLEECYWDTSWYFREFFFKEVYTPHGWVTGFDNV